jgi:rhodanese-related sulfurtransferase
VEEAITRLSRVGFDNTIGYLKGGFDTWRTAGKEVDTLTSIPATALKAVLVDNVPVFDVRKASEYASEHIPAAENTPLSCLNQHLGCFGALE